MGFPGGFLVEINWNQVNFRVEVQRILGNVLSAYRNHLKQKNEFQRI